MASFNIKAKKLVGVLAVVILALVGYIVRLNGELKQAKSKVEIREVIREVKVKGPVRIKYRKVIEKSPPEVIEKVVYKVIPQPEQEVDDKETMDTVEVKERTDRYLVGVSILGINSNKFKHAFHAGYSIGNRLDILAGVSSQADTKYSLQTVARF